MKIRKSGKRERIEFEESVEPPPLPQEEEANSTNATAMWAVGVLLLLQAKHYIPDMAINALLRFLCVLFQVLGMNSLAKSIPSSSYSQENILDVQHTLLNM